MATASLIITSIASPNAALKAFAEGALQHKVDFIVIGDTKSPSDFHLHGCDFYSIERQLQLPFPLAKALPVKHYSRKNIGYLLSKHKDVILESDDDNFPESSFWKIPSAEIRGRLIEGEQWVNAYRYFTTENIWPRGFPIEYLHNNVDQPITEKKCSTPIHQGLANDNPDVDAVYRMTMKLPVRFDERPPLVLGEKVWCPFNSQNTIWYKAAFPLLYLPSYCTFRMTDIWRSFIAQRIAWTNNWNIVFHSATVWQERNEHNLLNDFKEEIPGYVNNAEICERLSALELLSGEEHLTKNLLTCYEELINGGFIGKEELDLVRLWNSEFQ